MQGTEREDSGPLPGLRRPGGDSYYYFCRVTCVVSRHALLRLGAGERGIVFTDHTRARRSVRPPRPGKVFAPRAARSSVRALRQGKAFAAVSPPLPCLPSPVPHPRWKVFISCGGERTFFRGQRAEARVSHASTRQNRRPDPVVLDFRFLRYTGRPPVSYSSHIGTPARL